MVIGKWTEELVIARFLHKKETKMPAAKTGLHKIEYFTQQNEKLNKSVNGYVSIWLNYF